MSDAELDRFREACDKVVEEINNSSRAALRYLQDLGLLDESGQLHPNYRCYPNKR